MAGISRFGSPEPEQRLGNDEVYGHGADGDVTVSTSISLARDMYYNNLTVTASGVINTNGYRIFVKNTLSNSGQIGLGTTTAEPSVGIGAGTVFRVTTDTQTAGSGYILGGLGSNRSGAASTGTPLPQSYRRIIETMISNVAYVPSLSMAIIGGVAAGVGATGATTPAYTNPDSWTGKAGAAGAAGSYGPNAHSVNSPGGRGNPGNPGTATGATPGIGGAGGAGGYGGGVVVIVAKYVTGSGYFVSRGRSGSTGSAGTTGNPGTAGTAGTAAPSLSHTNPAGHTGHSHPHNNGPHHPDHHHYVHHGTNLHSHSYECIKCHPHSNYNHAGHHHGNENGHNHHHQHGHTAHHGNAHGHNPGHYGHSHPDSTGHHRSVSHWGNIHHHNHSYSNHEPHIHPYNDRHAARWHHSPNHHHHHSHPTPDTVYPGGAGGAGGAAAPAVTGATGDRGGAGGGGAVVIVTDSIAGTIQYDVRAGLSYGSVTTGPQAGSTYVILNQ